MGGGKEGGEIKWRVGEGGGGHASMSPKFRASFTKSAGCTGSPARTCASPAACASCTPQTRTSVQNSPFCCDAVAAPPNCLRRLAATSLFSVTKGSFWRQVRLAVAAGG